MLVLKMTSLSHGKRDEVWRLPLSVEYVMLIVSMKLWTYSHKLLNLQK